MVRMSQTALKPDEAAPPSSRACQAVVLEMFTGLHPDDVTAFVDIGRIRLIAAGEILCSPQRKPVGLIIILTGEMLLEQDGQKIRDFGRATYFGEGSLIRDKAPGVTITSMEPSWIIEFHRDDCRAFLDTHPRFGLALLKNILAETMTRLGDTNILFASNKTLAQRLRKTLGRLSTEVNERKQSEERARYLATHDALTGLANRVMLHDRIAMAITQAKRRGTKFAILFIDLDGFKEVNDVHGHPAGDTVLRIMSERLQNCVRAVDTVARLGGDEFAILQDMAELTEEAQQSVGLGSLAERVLTAVTQPIDHDDGVTLHLGASIGIAVYPTDGEKVDTLLRNADLAMYRAKRDGKGQFRFFTSEIGCEVLRSNYMKADLRRALENQELEVHYQPKVEIPTGQIVGMEALVRWQHPENGLVPPSQFVPLAEQCGLIIPMGDWIMTESCRQARQWRDDVLATLKVAVNLSPVQFRHDDVCALVERALDSSGLPPDALEVEITEGVLLHDADAVIRTMRRLRAMGVSVAVDDFGTGYSSLSYLKKFSATTVKIDKAFVQNSHEDTEDQSIFQAIISLAHSLGMSVVAEGVANQEQLDLLRKVRCDQAQGYFLSPPLSADLFQDFVNDCLVREVRAILPQANTSGQP